MKQRYVGIIRNFKRKALSFFIAGIMFVSAAGCSNMAADAGQNAMEQTVTQETSQNNEQSGNIISNKELVQNALAPQVWKEHLENDLMKFWSKPGAQDMSSGLFNTYLSNSGEKLPNDSNMLPEEIKAALADEGSRGLMDTDNNYIRAHSRLTYAYGIAYHMTGKTEYLQMCRKGALALQNAFDGDNGMYVTKNIKTGEWDSDRNIRTSQDLAYGITGMGMYYFLTHDEDMLQSIIKAKNYIFDTYFDENKGYITWFPKYTDDAQTQIVAQLDQVYGYMLMLTPSLPEPYQSEWKSDMKTIANILINRFYSEKNNLFWGVVNNTDKMELGGSHTDFGHSVKTLWVIMKIGQVTDEPFYVEFAKPKIDYILNQAYISEDGAWASRLKSDGTLDKSKEWWILAELDQAAEIMSINDPSYYKYLNNTQRYWLDKMVDHENGEIWNMVSADGTPVLNYPKVHSWKTALHSFEHALFGYMASAQVKGMDFDVYYAFPESENVSKNDVEPYMFSANALDISKGEKIADMTDGNCVYKVTFNQLY